MDRIPGHPEALLQHRAWLAALARQLVMREQEADELAHEALAAAVLQEAPHSVGPRAWLAAILKKRIAGRRREAARRQQREGAVARRDEEPPVLDTVLRFEVQRDVASAVLALPEPYRTTVLLRFWDGLQPRAIARRMQVPVETVRTRQKRGLQMLRERLDGAHGGDRRAWAVPLLVAARPVPSMVAMASAGVLLMTTLQKGMLFVAAATLCVLVPVAVGWLPNAAKESSAPGASASEPMASAVRQAGEARPSTGPAEADAATRRAVADVPTEPQIVVTGRVVDDATGVPIAGAAVRLLAGYSEQSDDVRAVTSKDGAFVLREVRAERRQWLAAARVLVRAADHAGLRQPLPAAGLAAIAGGGSTVDVGELRVVHGTRYSGRVVDQQGRGVAEAELRVPLVAIGWGTGPEQLLRETELVGRSDAAGQFVLVDALGPAVPTSTFLFAVATEGLGWTAIQPGAARREQPDVTIQLRPVGDLVVTVLDAAGVPCAGASVRTLPRFAPIGIARGGILEHVGSDAGLRARFVGRSDAAGRVRLRLPIGEPAMPALPGADETGRHYWVWVEAEGFGRQPQQQVEIAPGELRELTIRLAATKARALAVHVRDDLGAPVVGANVRATADDSRSAVTDAAGTASLQVMVTDKLWVAVQAAGHRDRSVQVTPTDASPMPVEIEVARTRRLSGRVVDQFDAPLAGGSIAIGAEILATADDDGVFAIDDFPMGPQRVVVALPSGADFAQWTGEQSPEVVDDAAASVTFVMQRRPGDVQVRIAVVDAATGEALDPIDARLGLFVDRVGIYAVAKAANSQHGEVTATGLPAGRWRLDVRTASGHRGSLPFEVALGQPPLELRLPLARPGTVIGELRFVGIAAPAELTLRVEHRSVDPSSFAQYRFAGTWRPDPASQQVVADRWGGAGSLRVQSAQNPTFRLDSADPTDDLVFTVHGAGLDGRATVRVQPGELRECIVEVRARPEGR